MSALTPFYGAAAVVIAASGFLGVSTAMAASSKYMQVFEFSEGLAGVVDDNYNAGFINQAGKLVIPTIYRPEMVGEGGSALEVKPFKEGVVAIAKADKNGNESWGFIDKSGKTVIPFKYASADSFSGGIAPVAITKNDGWVWGFIDKSGKTVMPFSFDSARSFADGAAIIAKNGKFGAIDRNGKIIVTPKYHTMGDFSDGLAAVFQQGRSDPNSDATKGKFGFVNKAGKVVIPIKYDADNGGYDEIELPSFRNGKAEIIDTKGRSFCINKQDKKVSC